MAGTHKNLSNKSHFLLIQSLVFRLSLHYYHTPVANSTTRPALTLYTIPGYDTCEQLREFLSIRKLQVTEKNVADDVNLQNELKDLAEELQVPVLLVGSKVLTGYNRTAPLQALTESGHITDSTE